MTGSNSSVHGENNMEDDVLVTRAEMDARIDARLDAALQRFFGDRIPTTSNGARHQHRPTASLVGDNGWNANNNLSDDHERAAVR
jgi:hypothetical protein